MILIRAIRRRVAVQALGILAVATLLTGLVLTRHALGKDVWNDSTVLLEFARKLLAFLIVAIGIAVPLGLLRVLVALRRNGVLESCCAVGFSVAALRGIAARIALVTLLVVAGLTELKVLTGSAGETTARLWSSDGRWAWQPRVGTDLRDTLLFEEDSLDVWRVTTTDGVAVSRAIVGPELDFGAMAPPPRRTKPFSALPISLWFSPGATPAAVLSGIVSLLHGPLVVLLATYIALLVPGHRLGLAPVLFVVLVMLSGVTIAMLSPLLWRGGWHGPAAVGSCLLVCLMILSVAHNRLQKCGLSGALR